MELKKDDKLYVIKNKTMRFLITFLKDYGKEFIDNINQCNRIAFGIKDNSINDDYDYYKLFILFYNFNKTLKKRFVDFLKFIKTKDYYIDDYPFDNILNSKKHMVVIKFPNNHIKAYQEFLKGNYSKMIDNKALIDYYFKNAEKEIITKSKNAKFLLLEEINEKFNVNLFIDDIEDFKEFSIKPLINEESF